MNIFRNSGIGLAFFVATLAMTSRAATSNEVIALVSAFDLELEAVLEALEGEVIHETRSINGVDFLVGEVYGQPFVAFTTYVGMTNAAMNTQLLFSHFDVKALLFAGIAGGVNPALEKGDIAVPQRWVFHHAGGYFNPVQPGADVYEPPPDTFRLSYRFDNFGYYFPAEVLAKREGLDEMVLKSHFDADRDLMWVAREAVDGLSLLNAHGEPAEIKLGGTGAAADIFMDNAEYRKFVYETWSADSIDMESSAVAQVCWTNRKPFLVIRGLSDLAGAQEGDNEITEYADVAWKNAGLVLDAVLRHLAEGKDD